MTFTMAQTQGLWFTGFTALAGAIVLFILIPREKEDNDERSADRADPVPMRLPSLLLSQPGRRSDPEVPDDVRELVQRSRESVCEALERCEALEQANQELKDQMEDQLVRNISYRQSEHHSYTITSNFHDEEGSRKLVEDNLLQMDWRRSRLQRSKAFQELKKSDPGTTESAKQQIETTLEVVERYSINIQEAHQMKLRFQKCLDSYHRLIDTMEREGHRTQQVIEQESELRRLTDDLEATLILASEGGTQDNVSQDVNANANENEEEEEVEMVREEEEEEEEIVHVM